LKGENEKEDGKLNGVLDLLIEIRKDAKVKKDYATSDKIRKQLQELGILMKDDKDGGISYSFE
jgi:cysteinyl-tRNA synthetase